MTILVLSLLLLAGSFFGGLLGALSGLGGGVVIVPLLTLGFGVDIRYAIGAALVSVIATSSGAAAAYIRDGFANLRAGMFLEIATSIGAVVGAIMASWFDPNVIGAIFGAVLLAQVALSLKPAKKPGAPPVADSGAVGAAVGGGDAAAAVVAPAASDRLALALRLPSTYPTPQGPVAYGLVRVPLGLAIMGMAGALSGLVGIGAGAFKVLAFDKAMRVPLKVSTTTSNFMIGVTATASAGIYLQRGYIDPGLALPVMLGVLAGALVGARLLPVMSTRALRLIFLVVLVAAGGQMLFEGLTGGLK